MKIHIVQSQREVVGAARMGGREESERSSEEERVVNELQCLR